MPKHTKLMKIKLKETPYKYKPATNAETLIPELKPPKRKRHHIPEKIKFQMSKYLAGDIKYATMPEDELIQILEDKFGIPIAIPTFRTLAENFEIKYLHKEPKPTSPDDDIIFCLNYLFTLANLPKIDALTRLNNRRNNK